MANPGYIYLIEAIGFHGIVPGRLLRRCKIGLSREPEARLEGFKKSQFPCEVRINLSIYTNDMTKTEDELHKLFEDENVPLARSQEWFDLNPLDYYRCVLAFKAREKVRFPIIRSLKYILAIALVSTVGLTAYNQSPGLREAITESVTEYISD